MSSTAYAEKGIDAQAWADDVDLITPEAIANLEDVEGEGYRFAAVAKTIDKLGYCYGLEFPMTAVLYVDSSGRYGFEREFFGHFEDWVDIPRTVPVDGGTDVPELPTYRQKSVRELLEYYDGVEIEA